MEQLALFALPKNETEDTEAKSVDENHKEDPQHTDEPKMGQFFSIDEDSEDDSRVGKETDLPDLQEKDAKPDEIRGSTGLPPVYPEADARPPFPPSVPQGDSIEAAYKLGNNHAMARIMGATKHEGPLTSPIEPFQQAPVPLGRPPPPPSSYAAQKPVKRPSDSTRLPNVSHRIPLDDAECLKKLTTYDTYTIRELPMEKPTWARAEATLESWSQEEILKQIRRLNERRATITEKKQALATYQQGQVESVMDQLKKTEEYQDFEWTLVQLDSEKKTLGKDRKDKKTLNEITIIRVYAKRAPRKDRSPRGLFNAIQRLKIEKMNQMGIAPLQKVKNW